MGHSSLAPVLPGGWTRPRGLTHGWLGSGRRLLLVGGQLAGTTGADAPAPGAGMAEQVATALAHVVAVVREAGGQPSDVAALRMFVTDMAAFRQAESEIAAAWRGILGRHFPAMTLVEVRALYESTALVEIEATALLADEESP